MIKKYNPIIRLLAIIIISLIAVQGFSQNSLIHPMNYFFSKPRSVEEKSYYANVSVEKAIQYFKGIGMIRYSVSEYDPNTIRFRNSARNVFVMVFRIRSNRVYIVMSRSQYVDEVDAYIPFLKQNIYATEISETTCKI